MIGCCAQLQIANPAAASSSATPPTPAIANRKNGVAIAYGRIARSIGMRSLSQPPVTRPSTASSSASEAVAPAIASESQPNSEIPSSRSKCTARNVNEPR